MMAHLPAFLPRKKWIPAPPEYQAAQHGSVFPPIQKLANGRLAIDQSRSVTDNSVSIAVFDNCDHPNIKTLPKHCPRIVRQLFSREWQLRFLRARDGWGIWADIDKAIAAWSDFTASQKDRRA